jgi:predicted branched-subunit amino acid permease
MPGHVGASRPLHPYWVLLVACLLPGGGHVLLGLNQRGFGFAFFSLLLALLSYHITTPEQSFIGRAAMGLFVWAMSIPDAYKLARIRFAEWEQRVGKAAQLSSQERNILPS